MNTLKIVDEREVLGKQFKIYGDFENPLFLAKDVAEWIDYAKTGKGSYDVHRMLSIVDEDEKLVRLVFVAGQNREVSMLTEDGLYEVLMQSRKPIAKEFKREVKKILKSIRKNGGYLVGQETDTPEMIVAKALVVAQNIIKQNEQRIAELTPKAEYFDALVDRNLLLNFRNTAKELKVPERKFIRWLEEKGFIYRNMAGVIEPYAQYITGERKYFEMKEFNRDGFTGNQTLITPRGREAFRLLMQG